MQHAGLPLRHVRLRHPPQHLKAHRRCLWRLVPALHEAGQPVLRPHHHEDGLEGQG